jgi:hypothetical protein
MYSIHCGFLKTVSLIVDVEKAADIPDLDIWLTVHRSITSVDLQLDAQNSYLFTYNTFIKFLYMFRALPCSFSGGVRHNCIYKYVSPSSDQFFLNRCTGQSPAEGDDTRGCIYTITT